jgi:hypothetical protein
MGTPRQKVKVLFDTGSPLMYVMSDLCDNRCDTTQDKFETKKSKTFKAEEARADQPYGSGSISGPLATDTICFGRDDDSCFENVGFVAADKSRDTGRDRFAGLIGLSPFQAESSGLPPFITQSDSVFSFFLRP